MTRWTIFLFWVQFFSLVFCEYKDPESLCASQQTCKNCLQIPRCVWCSTPVVIVFKSLKKKFHRFENNKEFMVRFPIKARTVHWFVVSREKNFQTKAITGVERRT